MGNYFSFRSYSNKTEEKDPSLKAFESFSKVSERVPALKTRALIEQAELIKRYPELKERVDVPKLIEELEKKSDIAKEIGMEKKTAELQEELKKLIKPEDDK